MSGPQQPPEAAKPASAEGEVDPRELAGAFYPHSMGSGASIAFKTAEPISPEFHAELRAGVDGSPEFLFVNASPGEKFGKIWINKRATKSTAEDLVPLATRIFRDAAKRVAPAPLPSRVFFMDKYDIIVELIEPAPQLGMGGEDPQLARQVQGEQFEEAVRQVEDARRAVAAEALGRLVSAAQDLEAARLRLDDSVRIARASGITWAEVGKATGMTHQAAHHRWAKMQVEDAR